MYISIENIKAYKEEVRDCFAPLHREVINAFVYGLEQNASTETGIWKLYSSTMMECSNCKKHVPYHRYAYCPHCGSKNKMEVIE